MIQMGPANDRPQLSVCVLRQGIQIRPNRAREQDRNLRSPNKKTPEVSNWMQSTMMPISPLDSLVG